MPTSVLMASLVLWPMSGLGSCVCRPPGAVASCWVRRAGDDPLGMTTRRAPSSRVADVRRPRRGVPDARGVGSRPAHRRRRHREMARSAAARGTPRAVSSPPDEQRLVGAAEAPAARPRARSRTSPTPSGPVRVTASRQTHSPSGSRSRWTVSSVLMKRCARKSSSALTPLPVSAATSARTSGEGGSSPTSGWRIRSHTTAGPGSTNAAGEEAVRPSPCGSRPPGRWGRTA